MKKILLLCSIIMCCMSSYAITLTASPASVVSPPPGYIAYVGFTVTASGETSTSHITSVSYTTHANSVSPSTASFDGNIASANYYSFGTATNFAFHLTMGSQSISQNYSVTYYIQMVTSDHSQSFATFTVTVTPSGIFYNVLECGNFTKSCSAGYGGSVVNYCVPINTYHSTVSQSAADNQAITDVTNNGQAYANSHGSCTICNQITGTYIDGVAIIGGAANVTYGEHDFSITYVGPTVSYNFTTTSGAVNWEDYSNVYNSSTNTSTVTVGFYLTNVGPPPAPITLTLTNSCGSNAVTANFTGH